mmetsp:Transcript_119360/g.210950  ORF Transcript_119360/g.210950 Transcript_119360/m.210950 type:complete len:299 (+) Transcript_119360:95-991(+)
MFSGSYPRLLTTIFVLLLATPSVADVISDLSTSEADEGRALEIKAEQFWKPLLLAAQDVKMEKHLALYKDVERVIKELPTENDYVKQALSESLESLRNADSLLFKQALDSASIASSKLEIPTPSTGGFSFFSGGQDFLRRALRKLVDNGQYADQLAEHITDRQNDILPMLRGAAKISGNVLTDCRVASKKAFDVRKYDIYNRGVPKTPKEANAVAERLVDAAGETRSRFTKFITEAALSITRDVQGKQEPAAATVTKASLATFLAADQPSAGGFGAAAADPARKVALSGNAQQQLIDL